MPLESSQEGGILILKMYLSTLEQDEYTVYINQFLVKEPRQYFNIKPLVLIKTIELYILKKKRILEYLPALYLFYKK